MVRRLRKNRCFDPTIILRFGGHPAISPPFDFCLSRVDLRCIGGGRLREMVDDWQSFRG